MGTLAVLLKESWSHVEGQSDQFANQFYARIFLTEPGLRELFPVDMSRQRSRMVDGLVAAMQVIDDPLRFGRLMANLGREHRRYHVRAEHYGIVSAALVDSMRQCCGRHWSVEYEQAWRDTYRMMASAMLAGAEQDSHRPPVWYAEVVAHERRGRDVAVFRCRPLKPYSYVAGQYLHLECHYHPREWRPYSIANAPRQDGTLDFHVRARDGWVSAALVRRLRVGEVVRLGAPLGGMVLDLESPRDIVCVAGGTGLAPVKSLVEELTRRSHNRWVHVFIGARTREEFYDLPDLTRLAARYPWLSIIPACSDDPTYPGETGAISDVVERFGPWPDHEFFVSGAPGMVRTTLRTLSRMETPPSRVRYDAVTSYVA